MYFIRKISNDAERTEVGTLKWYKQLLKFFLQQ